MPKSGPRGQARLLDVSDFQLFEHRLAGKEFVLGAMFVSPFARPTAPGHHFRFRANFVAETGNCRLDVNARFDDGRFGFAKLKSKP